jgi:hypothetical protein
VLAAVVIVLSLTVFRPLLAGSRGTGSTLPAIETSTGSVTGGAQIASLAASDGQALPSEPVTARLPNREALLRLVNDHPAETTALLREWLDVADSKAA